MRLSIWVKRRELLTECLVLLHDNARPHTAQLTQAKLFGWEMGDPFISDQQP